MSVTDRIYWFLRNLLAFILILLISPFYMIWQIIGSFIILTVTDGSEVIAWPWDWPWMDKE